MQLVVGDDNRRLARVAADTVCEVAAWSRTETFGLPSGRTPLGLYEELARRVERGEIDFRGVTAFAIDELYEVPRDHPATNAFYFRRPILTRIAFGSLHVMDSAATDAEAECSRFVRLIEASGDLDLAILGIGVNGHLAFNEPGTPFDSRARRVQLEPSTREPYIEAFGSFSATPGRGLTLGLADLMAARRVLLLANGASKARAIAVAVEGPVTEDVPASVLQRHPDVTVVLDGDAASALT